MGLSFGGEGSRRLHERRRENPIGYMVRCGGVLSC
jgi:hypothetical protein